MIPSQDRTLFGVLFPGDLRGIPFIGFENFEISNPGQGWKFSYGLPGLTITGFIYDDNKGLRDRQTDSEEIVEQFSMACNDKKEFSRNRFGYDIADFLEDPCRILFSEGRLSAWLGLFRLKGGGNESAIASVAVCGWNQLFVKILVTAADVCIFPNGDTEENIRKLSSNICTNVTIHLISILNGEPYP